MTANGWIQIAIYCAAILVCVKPLGLYMARVFEGEIKFLAPVESVLYRICGVKGEEQHWTTYTIAMLAFSIAGFVSLYLM
ncbi:MAG TPA: potassium-transporting ATPase subunit KdpA, partial [Rhizomicrobium sp.]